MLVRLLMRLADQPVLRMTGHRPAVLDEPDAPTAPLWPEWEMPSAPLMLIDPARVTVRRVAFDDIGRLQPKISRAVWRPAPGRKVGFLVEHDGTLIGVLFLSSTVINLAVRDAYLDLPADPAEKGRALRQYMDVSVCVGIQPLAWYWNLGKMLAMIAPTLGDFLDYPEPIIGMTTTSLWGRGSQYNRIWKFLGYTKGYGHEHIDDVMYRRMLTTMWESGFQIPSSRFGTGSNQRMRRIQAYRKATGDEAATTYHGNKRGVYYHAAIPSQDRPDVIARWYERWGKPRYDRMRLETPPYTDGLTAADA
jgi:hypothetical protein